MRIELHPRLNDFEPLTDDEYKRLKASIQKNGCKVPLLLWKPKGTKGDLYQLMDGRHRYRACQELDIDFETDIFDGTEEEAIALARSLNEDRRHRPHGKRAMEAAAEANATVGRPDKTIGPNGPISEPVTNAAAASKHDVSERDVKRAKKVIETGTSELQEAVKDGTVTVSDAAQVASEEPEIQDAAVEAVKKGEAKTARAGAAKAKEEQAAPEEPKPDGDENGTAWPARAKASVALTPRIKELSRRIANIMSDLSAKDGAGEMELALYSYSITSVIAALKSAKETLLGGCPMFVCPYCDGTLKVTIDGPQKGKQCQTCGHQGWVTRGTYKAAPKTRAEGGK